jgi:hypothetical protein
LAISAASLSASVVAGYRRALGLILAPVNLTVFQIMQVNLANWRLLVAQGIFSVLAPVDRGSDNNAVGEVLFTGCRKETVYVALLDMVIFRVKLALDGMELARAIGSGHQVNACIALVQSLRGHPVGIRSDITVQIAINGFVAQVCANQLFKISAFFALGDSGITETVQQVVECCHLVCFPRV